MLGGHRSGCERKGMKLRPRANGPSNCRGISRFSGLLALPCLAAFACAAQAGSLTIAVARPDGKPLAGAVVLLYGPAGTPNPKPSLFVVDQQDLAFTPDLTVVPLGSSVRFPNSDKVSHQVYSFSPSRRFQLPLYRGTPYPPTVFDKPGIVTLGCSIHDDMIAYVIVTDAPWSGRTDPDGRWQADGLPAGGYRIEVWHPRLREESERLARHTSLAADQSARVEFKLTRPLKPEPLGRRPKSWSDY